MPLVDQDSSLMDGLGLEALLIDPGLQSLIEELVDGETQDIIQLEFFIGEQSISMHSVEQRSSLEQPPGIFFLKGEQLSRCLSELGKDQVHSPYLSLVLEAVFAHQLQLVVDSLLFEGTTWGVEC